MEQDSLSKIHTRSGREVQPPESMLQQKLVVCESALRSHISMLNIHCTKPNAAQCREDKYALRIYWLAYEKASISLVNHLSESQGAAFETLGLRKTFKELKDSVKVSLESLRKQLRDLGEETCSAITGITLSTNSELRAAQAIQFAAQNKETEEKLDDLDVKEKLMQLEKEKHLEYQRIKLNQQRAKLKRDLEFNAIRSKLESFATNEREGSLCFSDIDVDPVERVTDWINQSKHNAAENFHKRCDISENIQTNIATDKLQGTKSKEIKFENRMKEQACPKNKLLSTAGRRSDDYFRSTSRGRLNLNPDAKPFHPEPSFTEKHISTEVLDPSTRHLAMGELKRAPPTPFNGEAHIYRGWMRSLQHRMKPLQLSSMDVMDVLEAHTVGPPRELVRTFRTAYCSEPEEALKVIYDKLERRSGDDVVVASILRKRLMSFPGIVGIEGDSVVASKLRMLSDLCQLVLSNMNAVTDLQTLNHASGLEPIRDKLPSFVNNKWRQMKSSYFANHGSHPTFAVFCEFLEKLSDVLCSDVTSIQCAVPNKIARPRELKKDVVFKSYKTDVELPTSSKNSNTNNTKCPLHQSNTHHLSDCSVFIDMKPKIRKLIVSSHKLCFRCLDGHFAADCSREISCDSCNASSHHTLLHQPKFVPNPRSRNFSNFNSDYSGNSRNLSVNNPGTKTKGPFRSRVQDTDCSPKNSLCTNICGTKLGRSCGKTLLVDVWAQGDNTRKVRVYAIVDDQSNQSFSSSYLLDALNLKSPICDYTITTLASNDKSCFSGRVVSDLVVKGVAENNAFELPILYENNNIPDTKHEIATPEIVASIPSVSCFSDNFLPIDCASPVALLSGRDSGNILATKIQDSEAPFVHRTWLGHCWCHVPKCN